MILPKPCIAALFEAIASAGDGPIFVYSNYEQSTLRNLAKRHPEHAENLQRLIKRLVDLCPLVEDFYYHPEMRGSFSIKKVLPTIAPELDYAEMDGIAGGTSAQVAYLYAALEPVATEEKRNAYRRDLLEYCKRDTWAMVEVAWHLRRKGRPPSA